jgi:hypothetical protein
LNLAPEETFLSMALCNIDRMADEFGAEIGVRREGMRVEAGLPPTLAEIMKDYGTGGDDAFCNAVVYPHGGVQWKVWISTLYVIARDESAVRRLALASARAALDDTLSMSSERFWRMYENANLGSRPRFRMPSDAAIDKLAAKLTEGSEVEKWISAEPIERLPSLRSRAKVWETPSGYLYWRLHV